jgi:hypothetical protein
VDDARLDVAAAAHAAATMSMATAAGGAQGCLASCVRLSCGMDCIVSVKTLLALASMGRSRTGMVAYQAAAPVSSAGCRISAAIQHRGAPAWRLVFHCFVLHCVNEPRENRQARLLKQHAAVDTLLCAVGTCLPHKCVEASSPRAWLPICVSCSRVGALLLEQRITLQVPLLLRHISTPGRESCGRGTAH